MVLLDSSQSCCPAAVCKQLHIGGTSTGVVAETFSCRSHLLLLLCCLKGCRRAVPRISAASRCQRWRRPRTIASCSRGATVRWAAGSTTTGAVAAAAAAVDQATRGACRHAARRHAKVHLQCVATREYIAATGCTTW